MTCNAFAVGLAHGVVGAAFGAFLPRIPDAFEARNVIVVAGTAHALLISDVAEEHLAEAVPDVLFSDPSRTSAIAIAHHRILDIVARTADVAPLRFGTLVAGPTGAQDLLSREAKRFAARLGDIRGALEFAVRVWPDPTVSGELASMPVGNGREYLRTRAAARVRSSGRPAVVDAALAELSAAARATRTGPPGAGPTGRPRIANAAFLVTRTKSRHFVQLAEHLGKKMTSKGLRLEVTGPWPAYSFMDDGAGDET
jgi:hypothetical protein